MQPGKRRLCKQAALFFCRQRQRRQRRRAGCFWLLPLVAGCLQPNFREDALFDFLSKPTLHPFNVTPRPAAAPLDRGSVPVTAPSSGSGPELSGWGSGPRRLLLVLRWLRPQGCTAGEYVFFILDRIPPAAPEGLWAVDCSFCRKAAGAFLCLKLLYF